MSDSIQIQCNDVEWREFEDAPGVRFKVLRKHDNGGISLLLQFDAGASYHGHRHPAGEEYYVLEGTLDDLGKRWSAGSYIWHPEGSVHRPSSTDGCVVLVILPEPIEKLGN
ncbi:MAG: cupin domain-containing protein [Planctomycetota bacterium]|jgi:anti-sigma factor ChrR (cupin superfamily)